METTSVREREKLSGVNMGVHDDSHFSCSVTLNVLSSSRTSVPGYAIIEVFIKIEEEH